MAFIIHDNDSRHSQAELAANKFEIKMNDQSGMSLNRIVNRNPSRRPDNLKCINVLI